MWGDDKAALNSGNEEEAKTSSLFREDTVTLAGTYCANPRCGGEDGYHVAGCPKKN